MKCDWCGKEIKGSSIGGGFGGTYCSKRCQSAAYKDNPNLKKRGNFFLLVIFVIFGISIGASLIIPRLNINKDADSGTSPESTVKTTQNPDNAVSEKKRADGSAGAQESSAKPSGNKKYRSVKIGNQTWMAENLNIQTGNSWCYENDESNCQKYGRLYDWNTAMQVCPAGWRLPTRDDWNGVINAGGTAEFKSPANHSSGGLRTSEGKFINADTHSYWWSSTEKGKESAYYRYIDPSNNDILAKLQGRKSSGLSVRCVQ